MTIIGRRAARNHFPPNRTMPKPPLLILDNLDDRREVYYLLDRLSPADRLNWLGWCCRQVKGGHAGKLHVSPRSTGLTAEVFGDWWNLVANYDVDPVPAVERLERLTSRRGITRRLWAASI